MSTTNDTRPEVGQDMLEIMRAAAIDIRRITKERDDLLQRLHEASDALAAERAIKAELVAALEAMDEVGSHIDLSQGLRIGLIFSKQFAGIYAALSKARAREASK